MVFPASKYLYFSLSLHHTHRQDKIHPQPFRCFLQSHAHIKTGSNSPQKIFTILNYKQALWSENVENQRLQGAFTRTDYNAHSSTSRSVYNQHCQWAPGGQGGSCTQGSGNPATAWPSVTLSMKAGCSQDELIFGKDSGWQKWSMNKMMTTVTGKHGNLREGRATLEGCRNVGWKPNSQSVCPHPH